MKSSLIVFLAIFCLSTGSLQAQYTYDGVTLPATLSYGSISLELNGAGLREKYFLDLYLGGLYVQTKSRNAKEIISADKPMAIRLHIISSIIDSKKMISAVDEGMEKSTNGNETQFASEIASFKKTFDEAIEVGDIYDLVYVPNTGVEIYKNGAKSNTIKGLAFKKALFGIWLCDDPADEDLKEGMLKG